MFTVRYSFMTLALLLLSGCAQKHSVPEETCTDQTNVSSLDDSTIIIMNLIQNNDLSQVIQETQPEKIDSLVKNFSPAEIAFESEVLNCPLPVILYFFNHSTLDYDTTMTLLESLAQQYQNHIKFVTIDCDALGKITQQTEVSCAPTFCAFYKRKKVWHLETTATQQQLEEIIGSLLAQNLSYMRYY